MCVFQLHGSNQSDSRILTISDVTVGEIKRDYVDKVRQLRETLVKMRTIFISYNKLRVVVWV